MAITKYKVIQKNLEAVINYALNVDKTNEGILVSGINCLPDICYSQMMLTKKNFHKEDGRLGYHIIQSFEANEVTPVLCNRIGVELANELWGDKYQVLVCTHIDKAHLHNHIILNSVSFVDGKKYHNSNVELALLRETNDDICLRHDLSIVTTNKSKIEHDIATKRINNFERNSGVMEIIKYDIDEAIKNAKRYSDFINELRDKGYYVKKSKNTLSVSTPYSNRNIRLARAYGEGYTYENIDDRIYHKYRYENQYIPKIYNDIKIDKKKLQTSHFYRLYVHYLYLFNMLPCKTQYEPKSPEYYKELKKFDRACEELNMIGNYNLENTDDVRNLQSKFLENVAPLKKEQEILVREFKKALDEKTKFEIKTKIDTISKDISKINNNIQVCNRIIKNSEKGEKSNVLIKERTEKNQVKNLEDDKKRGKARVR